MGEIVDVPREYVAAARFDAQLTRPSSVDSWEADYVHDSYRDADDIWTTREAEGKHDCNNVAGTHNVCLDSVDWAYSTTE